MLRIQSGRRGRIFPNNAQPQVEREGESTSRDGRTTLRPQRPGGARDLHHRLGTIYPAEWHFHMISTRGAFCVCAIFLCLYLRCKKNIPSYTSLYLLRATMNICFYILHFITFSFSSRIVVARAFLSKYLPLVPSFPNPHEKKLPLFLNNGKSKCYHYSRLTPVNRLLRKLAEMAALDVIQMSRN